jgi:hypothetical protein
MGLPTEPLTLTPQQIEDLNRSLATLRHDINNNLALIIAAVELIKYKPTLMEKMMATLVDQPPKVTTSMAKFTAEFEKAFGITRP